MEQVIPETGRVRLGLHQKAGLVIGVREIHVFGSSPQRPRRCMICGKAMSDHLVAEYRLVKEKKS